MKNKSLINIILITFAAILFCNCASNNYFTDRKRDAMDIFTASAGKGFGAKARLGPVHAGFFFNHDFAGLRGGAFNPYWGDSENNWTFDVDPLFIPIPVEDIRFGIEQFHNKYIAEGRRKEVETISHIPLISMPVDKSTLSPAYYTQIEAAVGILGSLRLGVNPGEFFDFILGWTTADIYKDDVAGKKKENKTESTIAKK